MRKIEITDYDDSWVFSIDRLKIIQGEKKYRLYRSLLHQLMKEEVSEFESESKIQLEVKINGQKYDVKTNKIYQFSMFSNLDEEVKMSAKSLLVDYLDSQLKDVDYQDEFIMLNQSIEILNQELLDELSIESNDAKLCFRVPTFTLKSLIKSTVSEIYKNELHSNDYDFNVDDKFNVYFDIWNRIAEKNPSRNYIVLIVLDELIPTVYDKIKSLEINNLQFILFANRLHCNIDYQDVYMIGRMKIDFCDDESIFENLVIEKGFAQDLEDSKKILSDFCIYPRKTTKFSCYLAE